MDWLLYLAAVEADVPCERFRYVLISASFDQHKGHAHGSLVFQAVKMQCQACGFLSFVSLHVRKRVREDAEDRHLV